jgi:DNA polymerase II large subunit
LLEEINGFMANLEIFISDIEDDLLHFPTMTDYMEQENETFDHYNKRFCVHFLLKLQNEFEERFQDFKAYDELFKFVKRPFSTDLRGNRSLVATQVCIGVDRAGLQLELSKAENKCRICQGSHSLFLVWVGH